MRSRIFLTHTLFLRPVARLSISSPLLLAGNQNLGKSASSSTPNNASFSCDTARWQSVLPLASALKLDTVSNHEQHEQHPAIINSTSSTQQSRTARAARAALNEQHEQHAARGYMSWQSLRVNNEREAADQRGSSSVRASYSNNEVLRGAY